MNPRRRPARRPPSAPSSALRWTRTIAPIDSSGPCASASSAAATAHRPRFASRRDLRVRRRPGQGRRLRDHPRGLAIRTGVDPPRCAATLHLPPFRPSSSPARVPSPRRCTIASSPPRRRRSPRASLARARTLRRSSPATASPSPKRASPREPPPSPPSVRFSRAAALDALAAGAPEGRTRSARGAPAQVGAVAPSPAVAAGASRAPRTRTRPSSPPRTTPSRCWWDRRWTRATRPCRGCSPPSRARLKISATIPARPKTDIPPRALKSRTTAPLAATRRGASRHPRTAHPGRHVSTPAGLRLEAALHVVTRAGDGGARRRAPSASSTRRSRRARSARAPRSTPSARTCSRVSRRARARLFPTPARRNSRRTSPNLSPPTSSATPKGRRGDARVFRDERKALDPRDGAKTRTVRRRVFRVRRWNVVIGAFGVAPARVSAVGLGGDRRRRVARRGTTAGDQRRRDFSRGPEFPQSSADALESRRRRRAGTRGARVQGVHRARHRRVALDDAHQSTVTGDSRRVNRARDGSAPRPDGASRRLRARWPRTPRCERTQRRSW